MKQRNIKAHQIGSWNFEDRQRNLKREKKKNCLNAIRVKKSVNEEIRILGWNEKFQTRQNIQSTV